MTLRKLIAFSVFSHTTKTTHWTDPRKSHSLGHLTVAGAAGDDDGLGPLPPNWAKEYNLDGEPYFIDHTSKSTTWYDPRLRKSIPSAARTMHDR